MAADPRSLNGLLYSLGVLMRDARRGVIAANGTNTASFIDTTLIAASDGYYNGAEVWIEDTTGIINNTRPFVVTSSISASGLIVLDRAFVTTVASIAAQSYVLQNFNGEGWPHHIKIEAILTVLRDEGKAIQAVGNITTPDTTTYWNAIPSSIDSVYRVEAIDTSGQRRIIPPTVWKNINRAQRLIFLPYNIVTGGTYALYGRTKFVDPSTLTPAAFNSPIPNVQPWKMVRKAAEYLMSADGTTQSQRVLQGLYADRARSRRETPLNNEVFLVDWQ